MVFSLPTEVCNSEEVPEVEIVSLLQEHIPKYRLRADSLTQFGGYENQDWFIPTPALPVSDNDLALTPDQIRETLNYFQVQKRLVDATGDQRAGSYLSTNRHRHSTRECCQPLGHHATGAFFRFNLVVKVYITPPAAAVSAAGVSRVRGARARGGRSAGRAGRRDTRAARDRYRRLTRAIAKYGTPVAAPSWVVVPSIEVWSGVVTAAPPRATAADALVILTCYANSFGMSSNIIAVIRFEPAVSTVATGQLVIVMASAEVDVGVRRVVIMQISSVLVCRADRVLSAADACT
ncbi:hypothetical protein MSG28_003507 [Choristoneura fumiferana]|uniref:Uncharacterized protein n=1 Tax=Choristoneura fumiferana TaxID=7141 RepID=A0ACC0KFP6_CHOFU|nr:hypothetical protein MSG28_003507 [Choristoneura fumiferana]